MKVNRTWLQKYFDTPLPATDALADALTFHAFEVEEIDGDALDINVLPDRAAYALCHRGIAHELSAILNVPLLRDPLRERIPDWQSTDELVIIADHDYVLRHTGALIKNVTVGPSPEWLRSALESVGQRSINNVVDILNYVLLDIGQPSGAFDLRSLQSDNGVYKIMIRQAQVGEKITTLTGEEYELDEEIYTFADAVSGELLDIAGIKGGASSGVTEETKDIFLSVGNYNGSRLRCASQKLKLITDASVRYQNRPSPELTAYGMRDIVALVTEIAGGELAGVVDDYPSPLKPQEVSVTKNEIEQVLGASYTSEEIAQAFTRFNFNFSQDGDSFNVQSPFERNDIAITEDLIEEVGRLYGYERITPAFLSADEPVDQARFLGIEKVKDALVAQGFVEVSTQSFAKKGDIKLANPLDATKPFLRTNLEDNLQEAAVQAKYNAPLFGITKPKLFEVGSVFTKEGERLVVATTDSTHTTHEIIDDAAYVPKRYALSLYKPFSVFPFVLRDVSLWTPKGTSQEAVEGIIRESGGAFLIRSDCFDVFEKDQRTSYAFHLVFQSNERTLSDADIDPYMEAIITALQSQSGYTVR